ncbi:VanZ family protein [Priestia koreensis]|uniref:VanZ family protein n=1 Tax=Priestia koreensis TaxID=284581 RepID=UPI0006A9C434
MYNILSHSVSVSVPINNLGLNILLFMPFGFFLSMKKALFRSVILLGILLSLFIEIIQFVIPTGRSSDIDDVILNTIGTFLGWTILKLIVSKLHKPLVSQEKLHR